MQHMYHFIVFRNEQADQACIAAATCKGSCIPYLFGPPPLSADPAALGL